MSILLLFGDLEFGGKKNKGLQSTKLVRSANTWTQPWRITKSSPKNYYIFDHSLKNKFSSRIF
jgi:hypothetical protein